MAEVCGNLAARKPSTINGTGEQTRDYVYVDDVARANVLALEDDPPPGPYNIGTGLETSENLMRFWHFKGMSARPQHRMVAHTGFLTSARRLADGQRDIPRAP